MMNLSNVVGRRRGSHRDDCATGAPGDGRHYLEVVRVRITDVETFNVFAPGAKPTFIWRDGLRGSPPDREVGVIRSED